MTDNQLQVTAKKERRRNNTIVTPKQEAFCMEILKGAGISDAYRVAYDTSNMKPASVNRKAKELIDNVTIQARLAALRAPIVKAASITYESHLAELQRLRKLAEDNGQYPAAIKAEELRGKVAGLYVDRVESHSTLQEVRKIEIQVVKAIKQHNQ